MIIAGVVVILGLAALGLVNGWATNMAYAHQSELGKPTPITSHWTTNVFAYHPVLMVSGFIFGQIQAIISWTFIPDHTIAKVLHVIWNVAASACMIAGIRAIVMDKFHEKTPSLTSMHSWVGVMGIAMFGLNFFWGLNMAFLTAFFPDFFLLKNMDLAFIHRIIGLSALIICTAAILTGIMDQMGEDGCYYVDTDYYKSGKADSNPSKYYSKIPKSCKVSNGLGTVIILAAGFTALTVILRSKLNDLQNK